MSFLKKTIGTLATIVALSIPTFGQTNASLEAIKSFETGSTYLRPTITYNLPGEIKGMTFHEFYQDKTNFGKTTLSKNVTDEQALMFQAIYGTYLDVTAGIGVSTTIPTPNGTFAKMYFVPIWANSEGLNTDRSIIGYYVSADLVYGIKIHSFGELNLAGDKPVWGYGEIGIQKHITDNLSVSYQPSLNGDNSLFPELEHRIDIKYRLPVGPTD